MAATTPIIKAEDLYKARPVSTEGENKSQDDRDSNAVEKKPIEGEVGVSTATGSGSKYGRLTSPSMRQHNPLGDFSSSTYKLSLYSISALAHSKFIQTGSWDTKQLSLIAQSGGITDSIDSPRAPGFDLDFYIDNLEIETITNAKETAIASNQLNFKFQIFEPYGMTFPTKLVANQINSQKLLQDTGSSSDAQLAALQGNYLLMIRFYGYDENGAIVTSAKYNNGDYTKTDQQAAFERSFPITINKFTFKINGKMTIYDINAKLISEQVAFGTKRGALPVDPSIEASTVGEALESLMKKINDNQKEQVKLKKQEKADIYAVVFEDNSPIKSATLVDANVNKEKTPMVKVTSVNQVTERTAANPNASVMRKKRTIEPTAGSSILQTIDQIITQSSYISDALISKDKEETKQVQDTDKAYDENANPKTLAWYIIVPMVEEIGEDALRNDKAYKITYVVKQYQVPYVRSTSHKYVPKYPGPHKIYNYWYTGLNTEVLSYEQQYNLLYFNAQSQGSEAALGNTKDTAPNAPRAGQAADKTSLMSGAFDAANSIKTFLYSPGDQLKANIKIIGDPDFLMPATSGTIGQIMEKWYGPDFTINPNSGQVFIELIFKQVEDYNNTNGLLEPNNNIEFWNYPADLKNQIKGIAYMVTRVVSNFNKGMFTQQLKTIIPNFDDMSVEGQISSDGQRSNTDEQARLKFLHEAEKRNRVAKPAPSTTATSNNKNSSGGKIIEPEGRDPRSDLEKFYAGVGNQSSRYYGLKGRAAYNPATDPRRLDR